MRSVVLLLLTACSTLPTLAAVQENFVRFESDIGPFLSQGDIEAVVMMSPFTPEQFADPDGIGGWHQHVSFFTGNGATLNWASVLLHAEIHFLVVQPGDYLIPDWNNPLLESPFPIVGNYSVTSNVFYLGIVGKGSPWPTIPTGYNVAGWAEVHRVGSTFTVARSAVAFDEQGIIVGTTTAIPEPGSCAIAIAGVVVSLGRRARRDRLN